MTQTERLRALLDDGQPHDTVEIMQRVYGGDHLGLARVGARIFDIRKALPPGYSIETKRKGTITIYRLIRPAPPMDLFGVALAVILICPTWLLQ